MKAHLALLKGTPFHQRRILRLPIITFKVSLRELLASKLLLEVPQSEHYHITNKFKRKKTYLGLVTTWRKILWKSLRQNVLQNSLYVKPLIIQSSV